MCGAGLAWEAIDIRWARLIVLAPPFRMGSFRHLGQRLSFGVASEHGQVLRDGYFGRRVSQSVVGAEPSNRNRLKRARLRLVQQRRNPVNGQVVGVLSVGATRSELIAGGGARCDGIGAEERMKVRLVLLAWEDNGIDVLVHERRWDVDLGVGVHALHGDATDQQSGAECGAVHRHDAL